MLQDNQPWKRGHLPPHDLPPPPESGPAVCIALRRTWDWHVIDCIIILAWSHALKQPRNRSNVTRPFPAWGFGAGYEISRVLPRKRHSWWAWFGWSFINRTTCWKGLGRTTIITHISSIINTGRRQLSATHASTISTLIFGVIRDYYGQTWIALW